MVVARVRRRQQMLGALLDPAYRMVELERQRCEDDLLRIEPGLRAETAADIGCHDPDATLIYAQNFAQCDAQRMRRLGRGINHHFVETVIATGEHGAAFER
jgi:hypothetical protein